MRDGTCGTPLCLLTGNPTLRERHRDIHAVSGVAEADSAAALLVDLQTVTALSAEMPGRMIIALFSGDSSEYGVARSMGIACGIGSSDVERFGAGIAAATARGDEVLSERILVFDADGTRRSRTVRLAGLFGAECVFVSDMAELFSADADACSMLCADINNPAFDVPEYVKRAFHSRFRHLPLLPFREAASGMPVHDILAGLKKVARVVMNADELEGFLAGMLVRRDIARARAFAHRATVFDGCDEFAHRPARALYHELGGAVFDFPDSLGVAGDGVLHEAGARLERALMRRALVRWLFTAKDSRPTCGRGV